MSTSTADRNKNQKAIERLFSLPGLVACSVMAFALGSGTAPRADVPDSQLPEVEHLLAYLENSGCEMIRNGRTHNGEEAVKHVRRKYEYYRDDISSTEDFIELSASRSTMSGKPYQVHCPGRPPVNSQDWLLTELSAFRART